MPNNPDDFTTRTTGGRFSRDLLIVGHVVTHNSEALPGAVVTPFPEIEFHHSFGTFHTPVALVLSYRQRPVMMASPAELLRAPAASATRFIGELVPVWFHQPTRQLVLAPHYLPQHDMATVRIPAGVSAHLPYAPSTVNDIYDDTVT